MRGRALVGLGLISLSACVPKVGVDPRSRATCARPVWECGIEPAWRAEARLTAGEVRVVPLISLAADPEINRETFVGRDIPWSLEEVRRERARQLAEIPDRVGLALPGAVNGELGTAWEGQFKSGRFPVGGHDRVRAKLAVGVGIDEALSDVARRVPAEATLFTWVGGLTGRPLSADGFPGMILHTTRGPVNVDHADEPYLVAVDMGIALVARDGEVILRYDDTFETILSKHYGTDTAARDLARGLAEEVAKVWAIDPRLAVR